MGGKEHRAVLRKLGQKPIEAEALLGVEAGRGFVDDHDQPRGSPASACAMPSRCLIPPGIALDLALGGVGQIHAIKQLGREALHPLGSLDPLEDQEETKHRLAAQVGIEAEVLGKVAQLSCG